LLDWEEFELIYASRYVSIDIRRVQPLGKNLCLTLINIII